MKEPAVKIQMVDESSVPTIVDSENIAGGVIISDCGSLDIRLYQGSDQVIKEFTKSGVISRDTDTTVIHAAAIADIMPILLKRSFSDLGVRAGITVLKEATTTSTSYEFTLHSDRTYSNVTVASDNDSSKKVLLDESSDGKSLSITPEFEFTKIKNQVENTLVELYTELNGDVTYYNIHDTNVYNDGLIQFPESLPAGTKVVLEYSFDGEILDSTLRIDIVTKNKVKSVLTKKDELLNYSSVMSITGTVAPKTFCIQVGDTVYYDELGVEPEIQDTKLQAVSGITNKSTVSDIVSAINKYLKTEYIDLTGTTWTLYSTKTISAVTEGEYIQNSYAASSTPILTNNAYTILLIANNPSTSSFTAKISPSSENEDLIDLYVDTPTRTYEYSGSTDPEYVNDYGANQFIENINNYTKIPFSIKVNGTVTASEVLPTGLVEFGAMSVDSGKSLETRKSSLEALCDQDDYKIAFLCPLGFNNNAYLAKLTSYNTKIWAFTPVGMYVYHDDPEEIIANRPNVNTEYAMIMAPHDESTSITDWVTDMTLEVAYLARIQSNKSKRWEFAPMVGKENSPFTLTHPSVSLSKSTREALLDARIMSVISRNNKTVHYLNKNKCSAGDTVLSEDQNARLACKINRDLDTLLEPIIGKYNIEETRSRVIKTINQYFTDNITNQVFSIEGYTPVCNEENNPAYIRANNQLVVDLSVTYLNAIYEVLVYHRALNVASTTE